MSLLLLLLRDIWEPRINGNLQGDGLQGLPGAFQVEQCFSKGNRGPRKQMPRYGAWALLNLRSRPEVSPSAFSGSVGRDFLWNSPYLPKHQVRPWKRNMIAFSSLTEVLVKERLNSLYRRHDSSPEECCSRPYLLGLVIYPTNHFLLLHNAP